MLSKPKFEFEIDAPEEWTSDRKDTGVVFTYDLDPTVKVIITFNKVPASLDIHKGGLEFFVNEVKKQLEDAEFRNEERVEINGLPAIQFEFLHTQKEQRVHKLQVFVKDGERLYSITCIAPEEKFYGAKPMF
ncbi:MAG: hypothetical protein RBG13Loki_3758, partial [Promethearchaeota archaeon CR_4]